jgi:ligand-binding sensor domain-containing protein
MKFSTIAALLCVFPLLGCDAGNNAKELHDDRPFKVVENFEMGENVVVRSLALEPNEQSLWVGTSIGVSEVNYRSGELLRTFTREHGLANEYVFSINIDPDGYKWFGTNAGGMSRFKDNQWKTFFPLHGLADYWVYSFANHPDGSLWVGTWAGVNRVDRKTEKFETYVKELINEWVYGIDIDEKGDIWFGTEGGVSHYDGKQWRSWDHSDGVGANNLQQLPYSTNTGLGTRSRHDLGVFSGGQATYNPSYVFSIKVDKRDQSIWAGTWGGGVSHLVNEQWINIDESLGLQGTIVYAIAQEKNGALWFGTEKGLSRFDGEHWQYFHADTGMINNHVYSIAITPENDVWVGTRGGVSHLARDKQ